MKKPILSVLISLFFLSNLSAQDSTQPFHPIMPLGIIKVDAKVIDKSVQLTWTVSGNEDAKSFEIERTTDDSVFRKIGGRLSLGHNGTETYDFVDALPKKNTPFSYRIKIIAKDGSTIYSALRSIKILESAFDYKLKQNPVRHAIELQVTAAEPATLKTEIYSAYGQRMTAEISKLSAGVNNLSLSSQNLQPGVHRLVLETSGERKVISFVKE